MVIIITSVGLLSILISVVLLSKNNKANFQIYNDMAKLYEETKEYVENINDIAISYDSLINNAVDMSNIESIKTFNTKYHHTEVRSNNAKLSNGKKKRVYEISNELKIGTKELIEFMKKNGIKVKSHMSTVTLDDYVIIKNNFCNNSINRIKTEDNRVDNKLKCKTKDIVKKEDEKELFKQDHKYMDKNRLKELIYELSNKGMKNNEIAQKLGKGVREIEIILKLQNKL